MWDESIISNYVSWLTRHNFLDRVFSREEGISRAEPGRERKREWTTRIHVRAETITWDPSVVRIPWSLTNPIKISHRDASDTYEPALVIFRYNVFELLHFMFIYRASRTRRFSFSLWSLGSRFPGIFIPPSWETIRVLQLVLALIINIPRIETSRFRQLTCRLSAA